MNLRTMTTRVLFGASLFGTILLTMPHDAAAALINPLDRIGTIPDLLLAVLNIVITIAVPIIILFIIIAGFQYVTARGNATQTQNASRALMYAIIGGLLIIGAVAITEIIRNIVAEF